MVYHPHHLLRFFRKETRRLILLGALLLTTHCFSQEPGYTFSLSAGYPLHLERRVHSLLTDSIGVRKDRYFSYSAAGDLEFANNWVMGGGLQINAFNYSNDSLDIGIGQLFGYMEVGYSWHINERLAWKNTLAIGVTQLQQTMTYSSAAEDLFASHKSGANNVYYQVSGIDLMIGHSSVLSYGFAPGLRVYAQLLYAFNRAKRHTIDHQPVFRPLLTPSVGVSISLGQPRRAPDRYEDLAPE